MELRDEAIRKSGKYFYCILMDNVGSVHSHTMASPNGLKKWQIGRVKA
jgi:hypothetical protein